MAGVELTGRERLFATVLATVTWATLLVALVGISLSAETGAELVRELVVFTGYFTILTNTAVALTLTAPLVSPGSKPGQFFRRPGVVTGVAVSITLVSAGYELLLRGAWNPEGIALLTDVLLHYLIPVGFVLYWWQVTPTGDLQWRDPLVWLSYPLAYAVYVVIRGELTGLYPYPFLDVSELGYPTVLGTYAVLAGAFLVLGWLFVAVGRLRVRRTGHVRL